MATIILYKAEYLDGKAGSEIIDFDGSLGEWIAKEYKGKQKPFAVYDGNPSSETFIPLEESSFDFLMKANDTYTVIETAGAPAVPYIISAVISVVIAVVLIQLAPKPKALSNVNRQQESPNNSLSGRSNAIRPFQRLPDVKGCVKSIPDVMMPPYIVYEGGLKVEYGAYVFGRKELGFNFVDWINDGGDTVQIPEIKESNTPIQLINGAGVDVYLPDEVIGSPSYSFGEAVDDPIYTAYRSNQVDGITLSSIGESVITSDIKLTANASNSFNGGLWRRNNSGVWDRDIFIVGQKVVLTNFLARKDGIGTLKDLSGSYTITGYGKSDTKLNISGLSGLGQDTTWIPQGDWSITPEGGGVSAAWSDWVYMTDDSEVTEMILNVIAPNGMYTDTGGASLVSRTVEYNFEAQSVDSQGNEGGNIVSFTDEITGNTQNSLGNTTRKTMAEIGLPDGYFRVRARRETPRDTDQNQQTVDQIKLNDVYALAEYTGTDFGDITWCHTRTKATVAATAVKERQINAIVYERLEPYTSPSTQGALANNNNAIQSLIASALDEKEGNLTTDDIDIQALLDVASEVEGYFPSGATMLEFAYTFDSTETTWQEMAQTMLNAINCIGYREGGKVTAYFEGLQTDPAMLFTHRSKLAGEKYTRKFNDSTVSDGVIFKWINPDTDIQEKILIPSNGSAKKPKTFDISGIRNVVQANIRANREYNKIINQKESMEFTATAEGRYVRIGEMISVVKGTRTQTYDGEVLAVSGLDLTLSQDVEIGAGSWYIQLKDETGAIEAVGVSQGAASNEVTLSGAPTQTIRTGIDERRTEFSIGDDTRLGAQEWLPQSVGLDDPFSAKITCINYSDEYYSGDGVEYKGFDSGFDDGFGL